MNRNEQQYTQNTSLQVLFSHSPHSHIKIAFG